MVPIQSFVEQVVVLSYGRTRIAECKITVLLEQLTPVLRRIGNQSTDHVIGRSLSAPILPAAAEVDALHSMLVEHEDLLGCGPRCELRSQRDIVIHAHVVHVNGRTTGDALLPEVERLLVTPVDHRAATGQADLGHRVGRVLCKARRSAQRGAVDEQVHESVWVLLVGHLDGLVLRVVALLVTLARLIERPAPLALAGLVPVRLAERDQFVAFVERADEPLPDAPDHFGIGRAQLVVAADRLNTLAVLHAEAVLALRPERVGHREAPRMPTGRVDEPRLAEAVGQGPVTPVVHAAGDVHEDGLVREVETIGHGHSRHLRHVHAHRRRLEPAEAELLEQAQRGADRALRASAATALSDEFGVPAEEVERVVSDDEPIAVVPETRVGDPGAGGHLSLADRDDDTGGSCRFRDDRDLRTTSHLKVLNERLGALAFELSGVLGQNDRGGGLAISGEVEGGRLERSDRYAGSNADPYGSRHVSLLPNVSRVLSGRRCLGCLVSLG